MRRENWFVLPAMASVCSLFLVSVSSAKVLDVGPLIERLGEVQKSSRMVACDYCQTQQQGVIPEERCPADPVSGIRDCGLKEDVQVVASIPRIEDSDPMSMITEGSSLTQLQDIKKPAGGNILPIGTYRNGSRSVSCFITLDSKPSFGAMVKASADEKTLNNYVIKEIQFSSSAIHAHVGLTIDSGFRSVICNPSDSNSRSGFVTTPPTIGEFRQIISGKFELNLIQ